MAEQKRISQLSQYSIVLSLLALAVVCCVLGLGTAVGNWNDREAGRRAAAQMTGGGDPDRGAATIARVGCGSCHTIPGIDGADALVGPPLNHVASRHYVGGVVKNTADNMIVWLKDPPGVDPKTAMPNLGLGDAEARDVAAYLYTLK